MQGREFHAKKALFWVPTSRISLANGTTIRVSPAEFGNIRILSAANLSLFKCQMPKMLGNQVVLFIHHTTKRKQRKHPLIRTLDKKMLDGLQVANCTSSYLRSQKKIFLNPVTKEISERRSTTENLPPKKKQFHEKGYHHQEDLVPLSNQMNKPLSHAWNMRISAFSLVLCVMYRTMVVPLRYWLPCFLLSPHLVSSEAQMTLTLHNPET